MIEFRGRLKDVSIDWKTGGYNVTFTTDNKTIPAAIEHLKDNEIDVKACKHREKRSLDSNAYAWVLIQKIAEAIGSNKYDVYIRCLQRYSRSFTHIIVKANAVERMKEEFRTCVDLGEITVGGTTGHQLQVYYGSSTFDTKEMAVFIDGIVSECHELGIETMTPEQIAAMNAAWCAR